MSFAKVLIMDIFFNKINEILSKREKASISNCINLAEIKCIISILPANSTLCKAKIILTQSRKAQYWTPKVKWKESRLWLNRWSAMLSLWFGVIPSSWDLLKDLIKYMDEVFISVLKWTSIRNTTCTKTRKTNDLHCQSNTSSQLPVFSSGMLLVTQTPSKIHTYALFTLQANGAQIWFLGSQMITSDFGE